MAVHLMAYPLHCGDLERSSQSHKLVTEVYVGILGVSIIILMIQVFTSQWFGLVYWGLTPQQQPGSYQCGEMMMMKSVSVEAGDSVLFLFTQDVWCDRKICQICCKLIQSKNFNVIHILFS